MAAFAKAVKKYIDPIEMRVNIIQERLDALEGRFKRLETAISNIAARLQIASPFEPLGPDPTSFDKAVHVAKEGPYKYRPLDENTRQIRVIVLCSSLDDNDPILCELLH